MSLRNGYALGRAALVLAFAWYSLEPLGNARASTLDTLHSFCAKADCTDGSNPPAGLVMDAAGNLYGVTQSGGKYGHGFGEVFELVHDLAKDKWQKKILHRFCGSQSCSEGATPVAALIVDTVGNLYGTTMSGSPEDGAGTVFELSPRPGKADWRFRILHRFCSENSCSDGSFPFASLAYAGQESGLPYDGVSPLYGTASNGGAHSAGVIFELRHHKNNWRETVLHDFCSADSCTDGGYPLANVIVGKSGNLFGATPQGGTSADNAGLVFELLPGARHTWTEKVLYNFCSSDNCADGLQPYSGLVQDEAGNLYGTTGGGGACSGFENCGVVFKVTLTGEETVLHAFCDSCGDGSDPNSGLLLDSAGALYGVARSGPKQGGTIFRISNGFQVLYSFCAREACTDGDGPTGLLIMDSSGNLLGTTGGGGRHSGGTVFRLTP